mgnify:CR=1 FL=1
MKRVSEDNLEIITLDGRIDQEASEELEMVLEECLKSGVYNICIDMINVKHICSSALGVLVAIKRKIKEYNLLDGEGRAITSFANCSVSCICFLSNKVPFVVK